MLKIWKKDLERANICFIHAPLFHPALKAVGPLRKGLGLRTFFQYFGAIGKSCKTEILHDWCLQS